MAAKLLATQIGTTCGCAGLIPRRDVSVTVWGISGANVAPRIFTGGIIRRGELTSCHWPGGPVGPPAGWADT